MLIVFWCVRANRGSSNGSQGLCGNGDGTNGGCVQRTHSAGLDETTVDPQSTQRHGGQRLKLSERDSRRNWSREHKQPPRAFSHTRSSLPSRNKVIIQITVYSVVIHACVIDVPSHT